MNLEKKYCTGCGLCAGGEIDERGFYRPLTDDFDYSICPCYAMPKQVMKYNKNSVILGNFEKVYWGYSTDPNIRFKASSGGTITAIAKFLLEHKIVDVVIQAGVSKNDPLGNSVYYISNVDDVINNTGSRYSPVRMLEGIEEILKSRKTYAFIGKPCDIIVVRGLMEKDERYKDRIIFALSFFCGGTPSVNATKKMVSDNGKNILTVKRVKYRGDGWPGLVEIEDEGGILRLGYEESWQKYLGRDMMPMCRFCWDGLGEKADIVCGDGWYVKEKKPDFSEKDGRNIIIARNARGLKLIEKMVSEHELNVECLNENDIHEFRYMQNGQFNRKATMFSKVLVMKLLKQEAPDYSLRDLYTYTKLVPIKKNLKIFIGMFKRIKEKKI